MNKTKVLLVEDDVYSQKALNIVLKKRNFDIVHAENGTAALEIVTNETFDIILMDIMMKGLNGFETIKALRDNAETKDTPIIVTTVIHEPKQYFLEKGATDYIRKPINIEDLVEMIEKYIA